MGHCPGQCRPPAGVPVPQRGESLKLGEGFAGGTLNLTSALSARLAPGRQDCPAGRACYPSRRAVGTLQTLCLCDHAEPRSCAPCPSGPAARITRGIKGVSARDANAVLGCPGQPFWQDESFDHWIRDGSEFERVRAYIEWNPVAAGLAARPEEWPWSSASK